MRAYGNMAISFSFPWHSRGHTQTHTHIPVSMVMASTYRWASLFKRVQNQHGGFPQLHSSVCPSRHRWLLTSSLSQHYIHRGMKSLTPWWRFHTWALIHTNTLMWQKILIVSIGGGTNKKLKKKYFLWTDNFSPAFTYHKQTKTNFPIHK